MIRRSCVTISVFIISILALSGVLYGQRVLNLDGLWGDMRVLGASNDDGLGQAVGYGDINGDGYMDVIIGATGAAPGGRSGAGETYVIFGSSSPLSTFDLSVQSANITICGDDADGMSGYAVASGDVNKDGYDDIIIGAKAADPGTPARTDAGKTYVIFGSSNPPASIDLSQTSANITVYGDNDYDCLGYAVASGDINGDGYGDVVIGAYCADPGVTPREDAGMTYVIFGYSPASPVVIDLNTGTAGITISGDEAEGMSGYAVASGDVNADGYDDIIIGAYQADPDGRSNAGETYVIFGAGSPTSTIDLHSQSADITIKGNVSEDWSGCAVASGDVNGDGYHDLIIGARLASPGGRSSAGETYAIFGSSFPSPPYTVDLSSQSADITIYGEMTADSFGKVVASGDINGDGYHDLVIGAQQADPEGRSKAGETYVVFGGDLSAPPYTIDLFSQSADITVYGDDAGDRCGCAAASGDINGDAYDDLIIGASVATPDGRSNAGETYVIAGGGAFITAHGLGGKSWIKEFNLLANGLNSFKAFGTVNSQGEVHLAVGDVDADSLDEIAAGQGEGGKSWVKFFEVDGSLISTFKAFGAANISGELHLAIGNFDADTADNETVIAQGEGGQSWVKVFETDGTLITSFKAFGAANAQGEVHLTAGDLENADGIDEIVAGMGEGGSSRVKIFNYDGTIVRSFQAFESTDNLGGEVRLAVGNFDADPDLEIAAATGYNGGNKVRLFDKDGTLLKQFLAFGFGGNTNGDVQITAADIDNDGIDEIICGHGEGGSSMVKVFKADGTSILSFKAFGGVNAQGEVHLGKSNY